jgi:hypothetical protein
MYELVAADRTIRLAPIEGAGGRDSVSSPITRGVYNLADAFMGDVIPSLP